MGRPAIDLTNQKFGKLTAVEIVEHCGEHKPVKWRCVCDCGNEKIVDSQLLRRGFITDCGCGVTSRLVGERFGKLLVLSDSKRRYKKSGGIVWKCLCDCGNITYVATNNLMAKKNKTVSCGCYQKEKRIKHNLTGTRIYKTFIGMKDRCYNKNSSAYKWYGARGIKICDEWLGDDGAKNFFDWAMANGYADNLEIYRINNDGDYEPSNCRWSNRQEQMNNTRNCHYVTIDGITHSITEWSRINGIKIGTIYARIKKGWSEIDAVSKPLQVQKKKG